MSWFVNSWLSAFVVVVGIAFIVIFISLYTREPRVKWVAWEPAPIETVECGEIAALSPDEFRVWLAPKDTRTLPQVLACVLEEARR